jgi:hypothetical protein
MISRRWRTRLAWIGMSAFVTWHTFAMVVAPAPASHGTDALRAVVQPYLTLLRLDNEWDFFAPNVGEGSRLNYIVEDSSGGNHSFMPAETLSWFHPNYFWARSRHYAVIDEPGTYADAAGAMFCRLHASLQPVAVTLYEMQEESFTREDYLAGKRRTDPQFFTVKTIKRVPCTAS